MFNRETPADEQLLDTLLTKLAHELTDLPSHSEEYKAVADQYAKLYKLKKDHESSSHVSPDVLATIAANIFGILAILNHERAGVVASKALSFVQKLR